MIVSQRMLPTYLEWAVLDVFAVYPDPHAVPALAGQSVHDVVLPALPGHHLDLDEAGQRPQLDAAHSLDVTRDLGEAGAGGEAAPAVPRGQADHTLLARGGAPQPLAPRPAHGRQRRAADQAAHLADGGPGLLQPGQSQLDVVSVGGGHGLAVADGVQAVTNLG